MKLFKDLTNDEVGMNDFRKKIIDDDKKLLEYLENVSHKDMVFAIMHLGTLFDTIATYSFFMEEQNKKELDNENITSRNRKFNKYLNDLNKRIVSEYGLDENVFIIEEGVLYDREIYLFVNQCNFIKMMQLNKM